MTHSMAAANASQLNIKANKVAYKFYEAKASLAGENLVDISLLINLDKQARVAIAKSFFFNRIKNEKLTNLIDSLVDLKIVESIEVLNHGAFGVYLNIKVKGCDVLGVGVNFEDRCACCFGGHKETDYELGKWYDNNKSKFNYMRIKDNEKLLWAVEEFYYKQMIKYRVYE